MKVTVDFLPKEYKSFVLDTRALTLLVAMILATGASAFLTNKDYTDKLKGLETQVKRQQEEINVINNKIASKSYNQEEIRELIDKFNFIREAVGARDFPYLRFFHSFERAIPVDENDGKRRIAVKSMTEGRGNEYKVVGLARHWDDLLRFEEALNRSTFRDPLLGNEAKNFAGVRMGGWNRTEDGITFTVEFTFTP